MNSNNNHTKNHFLDLPDEVLLAILHHLKVNNHLDLLPVSNTCKRLQRLASDYSIWNEAVVMDTTNLLSSDGRMTRLDLSVSHKKYQIREVVMLDPSHTGASPLRRVLDQTVTSSPMDISIFTHSPFRYWSALIQQSYSHTFKSITILPLPTRSYLNLNKNTSCNDESSPAYSFMSDNPHVDPSMYAFLNKLHPYLEIFNFPMLQLHKLISADIVFPQLHTLTVALTSSSPSSSACHVRQNNNAVNTTTDINNDNLLDWSKVKRTFPNLQHLTLYPIPTDTNLEDFWRNVRSLWTTPTLFPWIHSMSIQSNTSLPLAYPLDAPPVTPTVTNTASSSIQAVNNNNNNDNNDNNNNISNTITKDEIIATLSRLNGLIRIDAGCWDIIAVDRL